jgi:hypothetical protein
MKKLKIRRKRLLPLNHRFPLNEAVGGRTTLVVYQPNTTFVHI